MRIGGSSKIARTAEAAAFAFWFRFAIVDTRPVVAASLFKTDDVG
jgi:hypothetical protein